MAKMEITINDDDLILLTEDVEKYNAIHIAQNPDFVRLTPETYLQMMVAQWFSNRHEERIERFSKELTTRYRTDPQFRADFLTFLNTRV